MAESMVLLVVVSGRRRSAYFEVRLGRRRVRMMGTVLGHGFLPGSIANCRYLQFMSNNNGKRCFDKFYLRQ